MSGLVQSAFVVQSCTASAGHFVSHFEVYVVRPVASSQQTPPAQLFDPEQVSVLPPRQVALAATHVCVATQQTSVLESQVVVPHTVWSGPPSVAGGGVSGQGPRRPSAACAAAVVARLDDASVGPDERQAAVVVAGRAGRAVIARGAVIACRTRAAAAASEPPPLPLPPLELVVVRATRRRRRSRSPWSHRTRSR